MDDLHSLGFSQPLLAAKVFQDKFDVTLLHSKPEVAAQERMVDDGNGKIQVSLTIPISVRRQLWPSWLFCCRGGAGDFVSALLSFSSPVPGSILSKVSESAVFPQFFREVKGR